MDREIEFRCPYQGVDVRQVLRAARPDEPEDGYQAVPCPACTRLHFVHRKTGRLLGQRL
ncbi:hypothetical protein [Bradyrhizobium sp.]|uniref:hypothetical protein n=1 Tax=Bradyrhizobium sp. TaxID=376 RepID=UPI001DBAB562|nr:hypothetical protein [Bradyrhizobium sp.]MBI5319326.1 hypothetical protein [Bradyrhizobium sp.]